MIPLLQNKQKYLVMIHNVCIITNYTIETVKNKYLMPQVMKLISIFDYSYNVNPIYCLLYQ